VVITCHGVGDSVSVSGLDQVGGVKLRRFTREYDKYGNQVLTGVRLTFDSVYRYKGQEVQLLPSTDSSSELPPVRY